MSQHEKAATAIKNYIKLYKAAVDETPVSPAEVSRKWADCNQAKELRNEAVQAAIQPYEDAEKAILALKETINDAQRDFPELTEEIIAAEGFHGDMRTALAAALFDTQQKLTEEKVVENYGKLLEEQRDEIGRQLWDKEDLSDDIAEIKESWKQQAEDPQVDIKNANTMLALQSRQISALQNEIAAERERSALKMQDAVEQARDELLKEQEQRIHQKAEERFAELEKEHRIALKAAHDKYQNETIQQLKRQTIAHSQHTQDVATERELLVTAELNKIHLEELEQLEQKFEAEKAEIKESFESEMMAVQADHQTKLAVSNTIFDATNDAVKAKNEVARQTNEARKLALGVRTLFRNVMRGGKDLEASMNTIRRNGDENTKEILDRLVEQNSDILSRGVVSGRELRNQFQAIILEARDLVYVPEDSNLISRTLALARSRLEYLTGVLPEKIPPPNEIDVENLQNKDYLAFATYWLCGECIRKWTKMSISNQNFR